MFGALEGEPSGPAEGLGGRKVCGLCDVLQGVGGRVMVLLGLRFFPSGDSLLPAHGVLLFTLLPSMVPGLVSQRAEQILLCVLRTQSGAYEPGWLGP